MMFLNKISQYKYGILFGFLILSYFAMGVYQVLTTDITFDETAHIGAAISYLSGSGLNPEHPALLKWFVSLAYSVISPDYSLPVLEQYPNGRQYIFAGVLPPQTMINITQFVVLAVNSLFFAWVYLYTFVWKLIPKKTALIFLIIFAFSPSFYGHNILLAFDVFGAWTGLMCMIAFAFLFKSLIQEETRKNFNYCHKHIIAASILLFFALNSKYSNVIIFLPIGLGYAYVIYYYFKHTLQDSLRTLISSIVTPMIANYIGILFLYGYTFINNLNVAFLAPELQSNQGFYGLFIKPVLIYTSGIWNVMNRVNDSSPNINNGVFVQENFLQFASRVFIFKENTILALLILLCIVAFLIPTIYTWIKKRGYKNIVWKHRYLVYAFVFSVPVIYLVQASRSELTIGYRHFYPALIYVYVLISMCLAFLLRHPVTLFNRSIGFDKIIMGLLVCYIGFGIMGAPQGISYVNHYYTRPKMYFSMDSTINHGQEQYYAYKYLADNNMLNFAESNQVTDLTFSDVITVEDHIKDISGEYPLNENFAIVEDIHESDLSNVDAKYLVIDTMYLQFSYNDYLADNNSIGGKNWLFIQSLDPIWSRNDIIFIYEL